MLTLNGNVYDWFIALLEEIEAKYLRGAMIDDPKTIINTTENEI